MYPRVPGTVCSGLVLYEEDAQTSPFAKQQRARERMKEITMIVSDVPLLERKLFRPVRSRRHPSPVHVHRHPRWADYLCRQLGKRLRRCVTQRCMRSSLVATVVCTCAMRGLLVLLHLLCQLPGMKHAAYALKMGGLFA